MAIKGLSIPVFGKYDYDGSTVTYSNPTIMAKAVEYSVSWEVGDNNPFYADNAIAENDKGTFQSGELTLTTDDLTQEVSALILGTSTYEETFTVDGASQTATVQVYDDTQNSPYLGVGVIETHQKSDADKYRAVFFPKVNFSIPEEAAATKEDEIDWQTREITGTINRSDEVSSSGTHPWMNDAWFDSEASALAWLKFKCGETGTDTQADTSTDDTPTA